MYDIRTTIKAVAAETIEYGESIFIGSDGLAYVVDNGLNTICHGWALEAAAAGDQITFVTTCRMDLETAQTPGARVRTGQVAGGSAPSTSHLAGVVVGFAITTSKVFLNVPSQPAADGI